MMRRVSSESAQAVISVVFALFVFGIAGAAVIDVGLLVNDRRDAQSDVDRAALAGALALTLERDDATDDAQAAALAANQWAAANGIDISDASVRLVVTVISNCYTPDDGVPTGVRVSVERQPATFLLGFLDVEDWRTSASATACAGRPTDVIGFLPFALSETSACFETNAEGERVPRLGQFCNIVIDSNSQGLSGELGIEAFSTCDDGNSSAATLYDNTLNGTQTRCSLGDSVTGNNGHNVGKTKFGKFASQAPSVAMRSRIPDRRSTALRGRCERDQQRQPGSVDRPLSAVRQPRERDRRLLRGLATAE